MELKIYPNQNQNEWQIIIFCSVKNYQLINRLSFDYLMVIIVVVVVLMIIMRIDVYLCSDETN